MLSKTAEMKPSASAEGQEAGGSDSTGIIEAQVTSDNRNTEPLKAPGMRLHSGLRSGTATSRATQIAAPRNGKCSAAEANCRFTVTLVMMAQTRMKTTMPTRAQSMWCAAWKSRLIAMCLCCSRAAEMPNTTSATAAAT